MKSTKKTMIYIVITTAMGCVAVLSVPLSMGYFGWKGLLLPLLICLIILFIGKEFRK